MNLNFDKTNKIACNGNVYVKDGNIWLEFESNKDCIDFFNKTDSFCYLFDTKEDCFAFLNQFESNEKYNIKLQIIKESQE